MTTNMGGQLSNSDLELAAFILGSILPITYTPQAHQSMVLASNNTPAVAWVHWGSTICNQAPAYLLQYLATQCHVLPLDLFSYFNANLIADCCSCLFYLMDDAFLSYMNHTYLVQPCNHRNHGQSASSPSVASLCQ